MADLPSSIIAEIAFIGRGGGQVKTLRGFKKGHHTVPDDANATTNAFLGKICAGELGDEAETLFQAVRTGLGYKRKDVTLSVASPLAVLTAKDFTVEILYALSEGEAARYTTSTTLGRLRSTDLARTPEFAAVFARRFTELSFGFRKSARVESIVDAIEAVEEGGLTVSYPSDCSECEISIPDVEARVRCTSAALDIVFPRAAGPAELIEQFATVRNAFGISKTLAGLLG
jgi:hypothetical protein